MFTKNKKNYTTFIYVAIIVTLCLLIVALAWPQEIEPVNEKEKGQALVSKNEDIDNEDIDGDDLDDENLYSEGNDNNGESDAANLPDKENINMSEDPSSYYLVKRAGGQIIVFFCDDSGQQIQLETTEIVYELLGTEDQKLFEKGIKVESQEELAVLLQDFES